VPEPIATWNSARGVWERPEMSMLCGHAVPFSETWPTSFMTLGGRLYPLPTQEHRTAASGSSSLLPTPAAGNFNDGESLESWEARRQLNLAKGINGNGQGTPLAIAAQQLLPTPQEFDSHFDSLNISDEAAERQLYRTDGIRRNTTGSLTKDLLLLKTPTAQLAVNGGSQDPEKRKAGGHGPTLADQVERQLLPTPAARDWKSGQSNLIGTNARPLNEVVEMLLPTPTARTQDRTPEEASRRHQPGRAMGRNGGASPDLASVAALLPTPTARLGDDTSRGADPARYKGPRSLNGRRSNLDDCIAAVETKAPWLGVLTGPPSPDGKPSSDGLPLGQLSLDGLESDSPPPSSSGCKDYPKAG
jgi:hypothetical protein